MQDNYTINVLIPFDMVIDIDCGLLKYIEFNKNDPNYFRTLLLKVDDNSYKHLLVNRPTHNPISMIYREDVLTLDDINELYNQFMKQKYDDILKLSPDTDLFNLLLKANTMDNALLYTVLCKDEKQKHLFEQRKGKAHEIIVLEENLDSLDTSKYGHIYVKYFEDALEFNDLKNKTIYVANYNFNMEEIEGNIIPKPEIALEIMEDNLIKTIDVYAINKDQLPKG